MMGEHVPAWLLEPGDIIRIRHHHDSPCSECLTGWETDVMVTDRPAPVSGKMAISWAGDTRIHGSQTAITGISLFQPGEPALRLGHLPPCLGFWPNLECLGARVTEVRRVRGTSR
jgi:hypothetical protein